MGAKRHNIVLMVQLHALKSQKDIRLQSNLAITLCMVAFLLVVPKLISQTPVKVKENPIGVLQIGLSSPLLHQNLIGLQASYKSYLGYTRSYVGIEDIFCVGSTKRQWPGIGKYHYLNNVNVISALLGMQFLRQYKFNMGSHLKFNYVNYDSKLLSDNIQLKQQLNNAIHWKDYGLGIAVYAQYFQSDRLAYYTDLNLLKNSYGHLNVFVSAGIAYQLKSKFEQ